jgi:redox-sensitive bicupin YhaK (pirin superfamily)
MDQMGEVNYVPGEPKGTPWHRHRGFETVTYMIDGVFRHQDSNGGGGGLITDGDTQWMTAVPRPWRSESKMPEGRRHLALGGHAASMGSRVTLWPSRSSWRTSCRW